MRLGREAGGEPSSHATTEDCLFVELEQQLEAKGEMTRPGASSSSGAASNRGAVSCASEELWHPLQPWLGSRPIGGHAGDSGCCDRSILSFLFTIYTFVMYIIHASQSVGQSAFSGSSPQRRNTSRSISSASSRAPTMHRGTPFPGRLLAPTW